LGNENCASRPDDGPRLLVGLDLGKALGGAGILEDGTAHPIEHIDLSVQAVGEGQSKDAVADDLDSGDIRGSLLISIRISFRQPFRWPRSARLVKFDW
jgi:hypothetical protein